MAHQLFIVGALEERVRHAEDNQLGVSDTGMRQGIYVADVAIDDMDSALIERPENVRIEIDDADLIEHRFVLPLDLGQQRARGPEKSEDHDTSCRAVTGIAGLAVVAVIEIAKPDALQATDGQPRYVVAAHDRESAHHGENDKSK